MIATARMQGNDQGHAMKKTILPSFLNYPNEGTIIRNLLAGYTDLEVGLLRCIQVVRSGDFDAVLKAMFRVRGETNRVRIADALGRNPYRDLGLEDAFVRSIRTMEYCVKIRNQYAHCIWWADNTGKLAFANLEEVANMDAFASDLKHLSSYHVDVPLLEAQETFYIYADELMNWMDCEARHRAGKLRNSPGPEPTLVENRCFDFSRYAK
jgi:hypothetical protein